MDKTSFTRYKVEDRSYVSFIKREIHNQVVAAGFNSQKAAEVDIIISELSSNLIKHANSGEFYYRISGDQEAKAIEVFCLDSGPGDDNITRMLRDGLSSTNTLGQGLGSISRLSDFFQIFSKSNWGTVAYFKKYSVSPRNAVLQKVNFAAKMLQVCKPGETLCGDGYHIKEKNNETQIFLGDGLGHGPHAYAAVQTAIEAFIKCAEVSPVEIIRFMHANVKKTRGLVGTVAILNHHSKEWRIAGVGNISTRIYDGLEPRNCLPYNGIIGLNIPTSMKDTVIDEKRSQLLVMCSDGIKSRWDLNRYPSLLKYDASIISSVIFKDYARFNDDMTVLVGKS